MRYLPIVVGLVLAGCTNSSSDGSSPGDAGSGGANAAGNGGASGGGAGGKAGGEAGAGGKAGAAGGAEMGAGGAGMGGKGGAGSSQGGAGSSQGGAGSSQGGAGSSQGGAGSSQGGAGQPQGGAGSGQGGAGTSAGGAGMAGAVGGGIAAKYKGDVGIDADPAVLFFDDFESYGTASDLSKRWDNVYQIPQTVIATDAASVYAGQKSLEFNLPTLTSELANAVDKVLTKEQDLVHLRYYSKFDKTFNVPGSSHNGGSISAHYFNGTMATPGVPANGTNKFLVNLEDFQADATTPAPGFLNLYVYWPEQRSEYGDHFVPSGDVYPNTSIKDDFGPDFVSRPNLIPTLGEWHCYEYMVKANTPGVRDGRVTVWYDGAVVADFGNLRFRDVATLTIDHVDLVFHAGINSVATKKWYDNVVVATSYIGPMQP
jgi:hypothetical protein